MDLAPHGQSVWFLILIGLAAALYASVGQGGGSGYLAVMALYGMSPVYMKPAALIMNIFVTSIVWYRHYRAADFDWTLFGSFVVASMPAAFVGGALTLGASVYRSIVAAALLMAALRLLWPTEREGAIVRPSARTAVLTGAVLGLLSGATGVGGGIFLAPLLLYRRWCDMQETFAISAGFIWVNSFAAVSGFLVMGYDVPSDTLGLVVTALAGTLVGVRIASMYGTPKRLQRLLGVVLAFAALKMLTDI